MDLPLDLPLDLGKSEEIMEWLERMDRAFRAYGTLCDRDGDAGLAFLRSLEAADQGYMLALIETELAQPELAQ